MNVSQQQNPKFPAAYCHKCGLLFPFAIFNLAGTQGIAFSRVTTNCPKCQGPAEVLDATYSDLDGKLNVLLAPSVSLAARVAMLELAIAVRDNKISLADAKRAAEKLDRRLGGFFDISTWSSEANAILLAAAITGAATMVLAGATMMAPHFAPAPVIQIPAPAASLPQPTLRKRLMSGTSHSTLHPTPQAPENQVHGHTRGQESAKRGAKHHPGQKGPDRTR